MFADRVTACSKADLDNNCIF